MENASRSTAGIAATCFLIAAIAWIAPVVADVPAATEFGHAGHAESKIVLAPACTVVVAVPTAAADPLGGSLGVAKLARSTCTDAQQD